MNTTHLTVPSFQSRERRERRLNQCNRRQELTGRRKMAQRGPGPRDAKCLPGMHSWQCQELLRTLQSTEGSQGSDGARQSRRGAGSPKAVFLLVHLPSNRGGCPSSEPAPHGSPPVPEGGPEPPLSSAQRPHSPTGRTLMLRKDHRLSRQGPGSSGGGAIVEGVAGGPAGESWGWPGPPAGRAVSRRQGEAALKSLCPRGPCVLCWDGARSS